MQGTQRKTWLLRLLFALGVALLASCGGNGESEEAPAALAPTAATSQAAAGPEDLLPCYYESVGPRLDSPAVSSPETIRIRMLERPYRIEPNDIILRENRAYTLVIEAGREWHQFVIWDLLQDHVHIPPGGRAEVSLTPEAVGVFLIQDLRHLEESQARSTVTVIPAGVTAAAWHPMCTKFTVEAPEPGGVVGTPFVIQGSVWPVSLPTLGFDLYVTRVEAWRDGQRVGIVSREDFLNRGEYSDFFLTVPAVAPGTHSLTLRAILQNGVTSATADLPLTVVPATAGDSLLAGFRGNIDEPAQEGPFRLPLAVRGWAVVPGSVGTGIETVEVWAGSRESGTFLGEAVYGTYRPDIAQDLDDPRYASSGFYAELLTPPAGQVDVHVYVREQGSGDYVSPRFRQPELVKSIYMAEGLVTEAAWPVALAAAPDGRLFFAELLNGRIRVVQDGVLLPEPFATLTDVSRHRESGFLGLALHPEFPNEPFVYAMYVVDNPATGYPLMQRIVRFRDNDNSGEDYTVILDDIPATTVQFHNGGRILFGPDGKLYVSLGDTDVPDLAKDPNSLEGSILRYNPDGSIPADNPFPGSPVYAYDLRNVFGMAFQPGTGFLYATENGPGGFDEVNKIEAGQNFGWPDHLGATNSEGVIDPLAIYGTWPEEPIGPTGAVFHPDRPDLLLFCAYHDFYLRAVHLSGPDYSESESTTVLSTNCALDVTYSADGWLYYSTISAIYQARLVDLLSLPPVDE